MDIEKAIDCLKADKEYLTDMKICDGEEMDICYKGTGKAENYGVSVGKISRGNRKFLRKRNRIFRRNQRFT